MTTRARRRPRPARPARRHRVPPPRERRPAAPAASGRPPAIGGRSDAGAPGWDRGARDGTRDLCARGGAGPSACEAIASRSRERLSREPVPIATGPSPLVPGAGTAWATGAHSRIFPDASGIMPAPRVPAVPGARARRGRGRRTRPGGALPTHAHEVERTHGPDSEEMGSPRRDDRGPWGAGRPPLRVHRLQRADRRPPGRGVDPGPGDPRHLRHRVRHRRGDLSRRRGPDPLRGPAIPAPEG